MDPGKESRGLYNPNDSATRLLSSLIQTQYTMFPVLDVSMTQASQTPSFIVPKDTSKESVGSTEHSMLEIFHADSDAIIP